MKYLPYVGLAAYLVAWVTANVLDGLEQLPSRRDTRPAG
jgi:hypothetical protein